MMTYVPFSVQVEELRGQLRLLQAVGFGSVEGEDGHHLEQGGPGEPDLQKKHTYAEGMANYYSQMLASYCVGPCEGIWNI